MFSRCSGRATSLIVTSLPYSNLNILNGGPSLGCHMRPRSLRRLTSLREGVLAYTRTVIGRNNALVCDAYAMGPKRGVSGMR